MTHPKVILFDLGGVLIDFVGLTEVRKITDHDPGPDKIRNRWITSQAIIDFERGAISADAFGSRFVKEWGLAMEPDAFLDVFSSWVRGPMPGVEALLEDLRPRFRIACLSNTSSLHWHRMLGDCGLGALLDKHYASHLCGLLKPDPKIFSLVCDDLECQPSDIVFFDDGDENVEGARAFGLSAHKVTGPAEIRATLTALGLLT